MMIEKEKTNNALGAKVHEALLHAGVETPILTAGKLEQQEMIDKIAEHFVGIMSTLNLDLSDDSLKDSPKRVAKMYVKEIYYGLDYNHFPKCTAIENKMQYDEMVLERNIRVMSDCEHHFRPIAGVAHVAYIPRTKVLGLSKLNRVVDFFSRRPQVQERLTEQIFCALKHILETDDIAVIIDAEHFCVKQRGIMDLNSSTVTSKLGGRFLNNPSLRQELFHLRNK